MNAAMKMPSSTCVGRSSMKRRIRRGPSCWETSDKATSVIEKTRLAAVIIEPATADTTSRAPSCVIGGPGNQSVNR